MAKSTVRKAAVSVSIEINLLTKALTYFKAHGYKSFSHLVESSLREKLGEKDDNN